MNNKGYTLIELLLYVAILPILLGAAGGLFYLVSETRIKGESISEVQQQGEAVSQIISKSIVSAESVVQPSTSTTNILQLVSPDTAQNPIIISLVGGSVQVKRGARPPEVITSSQVKVTQLKFKPLLVKGSVKSVQYDIDIEFNSGSTRQEYQYDQHFDGSGSIRR